MSRPAPLDSLRVVEVSMLGPAAITTALADLGADVVKIEPPSGDYVRRMTWPIVEGVSLMHLHVNRGKRSITLDLKSDEGKRIFTELATGADVVVEAMRPGALDRLGIGFDDIAPRNPKVVYASISGYGATGPYKDMPSHGIAYDTWAGIVTPAYDDEGFCYIPEHVSIGIYATPIMGALGILAAVIRARDTGQGTTFEIAQSDGAAYFDWYRSETWLAYERPEDEVTGNAADDYVRRAPGTAGMKEGVRYQLYESADGHVLFMASERAFWRNFCEGVDRMDLFERWPGSEFADHARGNRELQAQLRDIFKQRTSEQWIAFSNDVNTPIAPVNTPRTVPDDPQFQARFELFPKETHGADQLPLPLHFRDERLAPPRKAPEVGEHTDEVLRDLLGWSQDDVDRARGAGAFG